MKRTLVMLLVIFLLIGMPAKANASLPMQDDPSHFSLVVIPDTQNETLKMMNAQVDWILENKEARNIAAVIHIGDYVNDADHKSQWIIPVTSLSKLWGQVPLILTIGNHDTSAYFNKYFPISMTKQQPIYGGSLSPTKSENSYYMFSAGGTDWLVISFTMTPTTKIFTWAGNIIKANSDRKVILLQHGFLQANGTYMTPAGTNLWSFAKKYPNVDLILSGHINGISQRVDAANDGHLIYQFMADYQFMNGGNGWIRIMDFYPVTHTFIVTGYSPYDHSEYSNVDFLSATEPTEEIVPTEKPAPTFEPTIEVTSTTEITPTVEVTSEPTEEAIPTMEATPTVEIPTEVTITPTTEATAPPQLDTPATDLYTPAPTAQS